MAGIYKVVIKDEDLKWNVETSEYDTVDLKVETENLKEALQEFLDYTDGKTKITLTFHPAKKEKK